LSLYAPLVRINTGIRPNTTTNNLFGVDEPMIATPEYKERRIMTYKEFIKSDLCKEMVRDEKEKERLLQVERKENMKKR
jgi:hypothetical protein